MKKILAIAFLSAIGITSVSAQGFRSYVSNQMVLTKDFTDIRGTPFTTTDWAKGTVTTADNKTYTNLDVKYSDYEDKLYVRSSNDDVKGFDDRVNDFTLSYQKDGKEVLDHYRKGYNNVPGFDSKSFFEVLVDGKTQLLKKSIKKVQEKNEYGSMTSNKSFNTSTRYYIYQSNKANLLKKDKKSILAILSDKQPQLEEYIKKNNLSLKTDDDLIKIVSYYNTL